MPKVVRKRRSSKENTETTPGGAADGPIVLLPPDLASLLKNLYGRVARRLKLDPSFVSRAARGELHSQQVEDALAAELKKIVKRVDKKKVRASPHRVSGRKASTGKTRTTKSK